VSTGGPAVQEMSVSSDARLPTFPGQGDVPPFRGDGLVLFREVRQAIRGEGLLRAAGLDVGLVAPPARLRKGCDLALEINLSHRPGVERALRDGGVEHLEIVPLKAGSSDLLQVVKVTDFGRWTMVRAANMKLTFDKETGVIVNASGGGCPDIPYLHSEMVDAKLMDVRRPRDVGFTLCALMMDRALDECLELWERGDTR